MVSDTTIARIEPRLNTLACRIRKTRHSHEEIASDRLHCQSDHIDLDDRIHTDMGCTQRDDGPNDVENHHAPLSQGARNQPVYSQEQFIQENFKTLRL